MEIHHLAEKQGHQHVPVQELDDAVAQDRVVETRLQPELEIGHEGDRDGHNRGPDVGNEHGQAGDRRKQDRVLQAEEAEHDPHRDTHDEDLQELAAHVVAQLAVDLGPDLVREPPVPGQKRLEPADDERLVLEHEEHQDRDEHQVDADGDGGNQ